MSLRLILTRHAKSDWGDPMLSDHDRPLNKRGRRDAPRIGTWLAQHGYVPDVVCLSTARRVQETWAGIAPVLAAGPQVVSRRGLYHAGPDQILSMAREYRTGTVLILCHNPGIADAAEQFARQAPSHDRFFDYPTAATAVFEFDGDGPDSVRWGAGRVVDFVTPHDLPLANA